MEKHRLRAFIPAFILCLFGVADFIVRAETLDSYSTALKYSAHDLSKTFFHIVLLPVAVYVTVKGIPFVRLMNMWSRTTSRAVLWFIFLTLTITATTAVPDLEVDFDTSATSIVMMPYDVQNNIQHLVELRERIFTALINGDKEQALVLKNSYHDALKGNLHSGYYYFSYVTTYLATFFVAYLIFLASLLALNRHDLSQEVMRTYQGVLLKAVLVISPWLFLRVYADFYISFWDLALYRISFFLVALGTFALILALSYNRPENATKVIASAYGSLAALMTIVGFIDREILSGLFEGIIKANSISIFTITVGLTSIPVIIFLWGNPKRQSNHKNPKHKKPKLESVTRQAED